MVEVLLFHHIVGLTPGVIAVADELRAQGHTVHTPDLYAGRVFSSLPEGRIGLEEIGFGTVVSRGLAAAEGLPPGIVYAGFSLGVVPAQQLAQTRPGARGALLFDACLPVTEFGPAWPEGLPVQVHAKENDALFVDDGDFEAAQALAASTGAAELFLYPGDQHLFADRSLPDQYDADAAGLLMHRVEVFLSSL